ncbi:glutamate--cysteine ligase [Cellulomonas cellasea]|uniref:Putative glutamate--cysteine ligase 2 n=1 Tax=Cellulomonas cellasea TaxID=43670 RepID=A0A7W4YAB9_9CELL|nr:glutamate--cysteine ligase [Cellulomonas cellasea]MBB2921909.1 carboxylate-amine ligase [Cellulomonas cellasea]
MRSIGIEEEFLLVSPDGTPRAVAAAVLQHASARTPEPDQDAGPGGELEKEFTQEQVETSTHPCTDLDALLTEVRSGRARADASAQHAGARVAALATAPQRVEATVIANHRARQIRSEFGQVAREQLTCGCHVHVEVEDDHEGVVILDHLRRWTPVLLALSANSPYHQGEDTSYASFRSQVWGRWPTAGPTAPFGDVATYRSVVRDLLASGTILDDGMIYFDARLSARYPTVEVRVPDVCLDPADAVLQGALVRALADTAVEHAGRPDLEQPRTEVMRVAAWRAARSGLSGGLVSPALGTSAPAADVVAELLAHVRPALEASGDLEWVSSHVKEVLARGNGAIQQRRWRDGGADDSALVARAVEATLA